MLSLVILYSIIIVLLLLVIKFWLKKVEINQQLDQQRKNLIQKIRANEEQLKMIHESNALMLKHCIKINEQLLQFSENEVEKKLNVSSIQILIQNSIYLLQKNIHH